jgi:hypothetical protein
VNFVLAISLSCIAGIVHAQSNSPYSRFGIGDLLDEDNIENRGSGSATITQDNDRRINAVNPATLAGLRVTTLQFGLIGSRNVVASASKAQTVGSFNISNFAFGIPLGKNGGFAFGLQPYSRVNYSLKKSGINPEDSTLLLNSYFGQGGTQKVYAGYGYKYKGLSLGASAAFIFGGSTYSTINSLESDTVAFAVRYTNGRYITGLQYTLGAHYAAKLNKNLTLKVGATYVPSAKLSSTKDELYVTPYGFNGSSVALDDTISSSFNQKGKVIVPSTMSFGASINKDMYWRFGVEYSSSDWSKYSSHSQTDSLGRSYRIRAGWAYIPDPTAGRKKYWSKVEYRLGYYMGDDIYKLRGQNIAISGFTAGMGMPFRSYGLSLGTFNWGLQVGRKGTSTNGLFSDAFTRFSFGITLNDLSWFRKRRYD